MMIYLVLTGVLFAAMLVYFKLADRFNIIDRPNQRSSHTRPTYRGGGILFPLAALLWFFFMGRQMPLAIAGLVIISAISFVDDIRPMPAGVRMLFHLLAVGLLLLALGITGFHWYWILAALVLTTGCINAFNFMDGINGITALYGMVALGTFSMLNHAEKLIAPFFPGDVQMSLGAFAPEGLVGFVFVGVAVFSVFNARGKAKTFAGDVGSFSLGFILAWLMLALMIASNNFHWILLFAVYGIDAGYTLLRRLIKGENIFQAHRQHLYQRLSNEGRWPHLKTALAYGLAQLLVNAATIFLILQGTMTTPIFLAILALLTLTYAVIRNK